MTFLVIVIVNRSQSNRSKTQNIRNIISFDKSTKIKKNS